MIVEAAEHARAETDRLAWTKRRLRACRVGRRTAAVDWSARARRKEPRCRVTRTAAPTPTPRGVEGVTSRSGPLARSRAGSVVGERVLPAPHRLAGRQGRLREDTPGGGVEARLQVDAGTSSISTSISRDVERRRAQSAREVVNCVHQVVDAGDLAGAQQVHDGVGDIGGVGGGAPFVGNTRGRLSPPAAARSAAARIFAGKSGFPGPKSHAVRAMRQLRAGGVLERRHGRPLRGQLARAVGVDRVRRRPTARSPRRPVRRPSKTSFVETRSGRRRSRRIPPRGRRSRVRCAPAPGPVRVRSRRRRSRRRSARRHRGGRGRSGRPRRRARRGRNRCASRRSRRPGL